MLTVKVEHPGIAWLSMHDQENHNALSERFVLEFEKKLAAIKNDKTIKVVVLAGLDDYFCSGASSDMLENIKHGNIAPVEITMASWLINFPVPVISAAKGSAIGGGFALALAADIVIIAEESYYGANFVQLGFTPGMGLTQLLEHCVSRAVAHELLYTGELRKGKKFLGNTGFNAIVKQAEVEAKALDIALRIAEHNRKTLSILKRSLSLPRRKLFEESLTVESLMHEITFSNYDANNLPGGLMK